MVVLINIVPYNYNIFGNLSPFELADDHLNFCGCDDPINPIVYDVKITAGVMWRTSSSCLNKRVQKFYRCLRLAQAALESNHLLNLDICRPQTTEKST